MNRLRQRLASMSKDDRMVFLPIALASAAILLPAADVLLRSI